PYESPVGVLGAVLQWVQKRFGAFVRYLSAARHLAGGRRYPGDGGRAYRCRGARDRCVHLGLPEMDAFAAGVRVFLPVRRDAGADRGPVHELAGGGLEYEIFRPVPLRPEMDPGGAALRARLLCDAQSPRYAGVGR